MLPGDEILGAIVTVAVYSLCILLLLARLAEQPRIEYRLGVGVLLAAVPLAYLAIRAPQWDRSPIFYVQVGLMLLYIVVEFVLDYWLHVDFRQARWAVVCYVTLFFGATGGMLGIAALAGRGWSITSVLLFLVMTALAFVQRSMTGM